MDLFRPSRNQPQIKGKSKMALMAVSSESLIICVRSYLYLLLYNRQVRCKESPWCSWHGGIHKGAIKYSFLVYSQAICRFSLDNLYIVRKHQRISISNPTGISSRSTDMGAFFGPTCWHAACKTNNTLAGLPFHWLFSSLQLSGFTWYLWFVDCALLSRLLLICIYLHPIFANILLVISKIKLVEVKF